MNRRKILIAAALAGITAAGVSAVSADSHSGKEKCYGIAKAGANDCANATGTHSCAGQATTDNDPNEWKFVAKGSCTEMGGSVKPGGKS